MHREPKWGKVANRFRGMANRHYSLQSIARQAYECVGRTCHRHRSSMLTIDARIGIHYFPYHRVPSVLTK